MHEVRPQGEANLGDSRRAPAHLWIVAVLGTLWNGFGALDYTMTQMRHPAWMGQMTADQQSFLEGAPYWLDATWALGVWGGLLGSLLLLARSRYAVAAFIVSLVGLAGNTLSQLTLPEPSPHLDSGGGIALHAAVWAIAIGLLAYSIQTRRRGTLR
jgi:hypothetical protein